MIVLAFLAGATIGGLSVACVFLWKLAFPAEQKPIRTAGRQRSRSTQTTLPFETPSSPPEPRTNFSPAPSRIPMARPAMRTYLAKLQRAESGPVVEKGGA